MTVVSWRPLETQRRVGLSGAITTCIDDWLQENEWLEAIGTRRTRGTIPALPSPSPQLFSLGERAAPVSARAEKAARGVLLPRLDDGFPLPKEEG